VAPYHLFFLNYKNEITGMATIQCEADEQVSLSLIHANQRINLLAGGDVVRGSCDFLATQDGLLGSAISQTG
jgi:hypothetical protein